MPTITSYSTLVTAVTEYLAREEDATLIARIPSFIQLTEAKLNRELFVRQMEARSTTTTDVATAEPEFITLPDDFQSMRRVRLSGVTGKPQLAFKSGVQMEEYRAQRGNATGQPAYFTIFGSEIELCPTPGVNVQIEMVYRANIPALTDAASVNWLITMAPDIYLYGALLESAPYIKEDARLQVWGAGFSSSLDSLNRLGMTSTFNAGPIAMTTSGYTP